MNQGNEKTGPTKRIHHRMTSVREFLIIYGGYDTKNHTECNELWRYDTIRGVWKRYQPPIEIKDRCVFSTICTLGNLVYIFGGESFNNIHRQTNCLVSFDISNAAWKILSPHIDEYDENTPPPMSRNLLCSNKGSLYVLQGYSKYGKLYTLYKFCLRTLTWSLVEQHGPAPLYIAGIFGTVYKNKSYFLKYRLYCFGGSSVEIKKFYHIAIFDISTNIWTITAMVSKNQQYPDQRTFESFAFSGKFGYMSGGKIFGTETYFYDIWRIDLAALEWLKLDYVYKFYI
ncbi:Nitrile-specifier protein 3 [Thelohanellus kitauei]|uniref:Nitrile-specifier protein 3 n=1 Tax=Thelohanellus kitauei TaxID=669202 RepID=A0A0C2NB63_THEKT|nr:Nitrile-specifier protein 3 [Thelohanellus kitauei]